MSDADRYNLREFRAGRLLPAHMSALVRAFQETRPGLAIDGKAGSETRLALEHGDPAAPPAVPVPSWDPFDGPLPRIPGSRAEVFERFGNPGATTLDRGWRRRNIVRARDLPGVPEHLHVHCHRLAEPYLREALRRVNAASPEFPIERLGCFVYRRQRHDPGRPLSYHSWGIAVDINPRANAAKRYGAPPAPFSEEWQKVWPDPGAVTPAVVAGFESVGFSWGGRWRHFIDAQHFELLSRGT